MDNENFRKIIIDRITREGPITFREFMDMALYYPGGGYYRSERMPIGPEGDYYTSPHLHPVFGWLLAVQLDEMRDKMGAPGGFTVLEIGAGKGFLARDIIDFVQRNLHWRNWQYIILEKSPYTSNIQKKLLEDFRDVIRWVKDLKELEPFRGAVITNELLDAFPIHMIEYRHGFKEVHVSCEGDDFKEVFPEIDNEELVDYISEYNLPVIDGYRTEVNLAIRDFLKRVDAVLFEGFIITVDYGYPSWEYYSEERNRGTLLCYHYHNTSENPYENIGSQDITAHVNFSSVKRWGEAIGLSTAGYCPQGTFLVSLGIDRMIAEEIERNPDFLRDIPKIKGLILGIGDTHKVLVQYKGDMEITTLRGFKLRNRVGRL
ncbi:hypothetical protein BMS3Bbin06_01865 [bacterium BMS3Bbin06]|nr:hypothetical protein BMS3Abin08_01811 [bacterium BMS3Abin08]GBE35327.1 hypothetical protein BMS3Bbin06_01865 [bacterium BMS3Bbin06]HDO36209.1 methyltransferase [Nitrospirota bacterium]HDY70976.1 methyltransferase [Nitrospirota bacterium]